MSWNPFRQYSSRSAVPAMRGLHRFGLISLAIYLLELWIAVRMTLLIGPPDGHVLEFARRARRVKTVARLLNAHHVAVEGHEPAGAIEAADDRAQ